MILWDFNLSPIKLILVKFNLNIIKSELFVRICFGMENATGIGVHKHIVFIGWLLALQLVIEVALPLLFTTLSTVRLSQRYHGKETLPPQSRSD